MSASLGALILVLASAAAAAQPPLSPEVLKAQGERIEVMAKSKAAVLSVFSADGGGGGSGVVISADGYALTNFHVVEPCGNAMKCGMADGRLYDAVLVGIDPTGDVALIQLFGRQGFPTAEFGDSDQVETGDWVFAMGNPFLLATDFQPTVTYGIISGTHRYQFPAGTILEYTDCLQTDASINPGNSGGPLFDARGRLIGINGRASFYKRGRVSVGVGYAISINQIKNFLGDLRSGRVVDHATLGARVGQDEEGRVVVTDILEQSDAFRRGLRYGDEIVSFGSRSIETPNAFKNVLGILPQGWRVPLSFRRDGRRHEILVRLQAAHGEGELAETLSQHREPPMPIPKPDRQQKHDRLPGGEDKMPGGKGRIPGAPGKTPEGHEKNPPRGEIPEGEDPIVQALKKKAPLPEIVRQHFQEKPRYANYYYNKLNRDRVWKGWVAHGDFAGLHGTWTLAGHAAGGTPFTIQLGPRDATLNQWKWTPADPIDATLSPPGSGGLLLALSLWRRLAVEGPDRFGDVSYWGTAPLAGHEGPVDVLVAIHAGVECRFMFHPLEGQLLAVEMSSGEETDPCEIYFGDYREVDGRWLPQAMEARCGDDLFASFRLESYQFQRDGKP
jgi:S1-C subfamily serine protease